MSLESFQIPQTLMDKVLSILEGKEENPERSPLTEDEKKKLLVEKGKKKKEEEEIEEVTGEKIIINPEFHPDRQTVEPNKPSKIV
jgi:hypothetical protein